MSANNRIGGIRPSQMITTFGPGSIVPLRTISVVVMGLDYWPSKKDDYIKISEPRLQKKLGKQAFRCPVSQRNKNQLSGGVPVNIFPRWLVCPACRRLAPCFKPHSPFKWDDHSLRFKCRAPGCPGKGKAEPFPVRFIVACEDGHLDDFPWEWYVHQHKRQGCPGGELRLVSSGRSGSISDVKVECKKCGASRPISHALGKGTLGKCTGRRVWLADSTSCSKERRLVMIGASNVWFPIICSALSIPPWGDEYVKAIIESSDDWKKYLGVFDKSDLVNFRKKETLFELFEKLGELPDFDFEKFLEAWNNLKELNASDKEPDIKEEEWRVFKQTNSSRWKEEYFETKRTSPPKALDRWIDRVVLVPRLREVRVLRSFTRINPPTDAGALCNAQTGAGPDLLATKTNLDWLPAVENKGEGILIVFKEKAVRQWEKKYEKWCNTQNPKRDPAFGRYVLLHSIAHLLIRELSLHCGYSSSSIRERIYSSRPKKMAGILLYTAVSDSEGSLGGLVEMGEPDHLEQIMMDALKRARRCSSDPFCSQDPSHEGAACHACLLVSETSCENLNDQLDRNVVVPTFAGTAPPFFENI